MDYFLYIIFIITSVALIVVPGPNVLTVVSTSIAHGSKRGLLTVLGTSFAMIIQLIATALGTTLFVEFMVNGFEWLRWLGVAYLIYLGIAQLSTIFKDKKRPKITGISSFARGFIVSLINPKTIIFFSAFLPQFVSPRGEYMIQIILLSATFLVLATLLDSLYAIMAGSLREYILGKRAQKIQNGLSGMLYLGAGAWLAAIRKI